MTKNRLIKITSILVCIALFAYLFVHVTYTFRDPLSYTQEHITGFYAEDKNTIDVIVLGTSATFSAYMPMELWGEYGITAYDFCTNVMLEESMPYAIREFEKTQDPKLVVIDLATFMYGHNSIFSIDNEAQYRFNVDAYKLSKNRIDLINKIIVDDRDKLPYYFDLMYYHESYHPNLKYWNNSLHGIQKGYSNLQIEVSYPQGATQGVGNVSEEYADKIGDIGDYEYPQLDGENLNILLDELEKYDFDVLFAIDPYYVSDEKSFIYYCNAEYLKELLRSKGYDVLDMCDYYEEIGINPETDYSLDALHYHIESAQKITHFMGDYIDANYNIPDHRNDNRYKQWSKDYIEWQDKVLEDEEWTRLDREKYIKEH